LIQDTLQATPLDSLYRWLDQHGEAFGAPGMEPRWTSSVKDAVGTAYSASSRIWFTVSHGILNEIYHPTIDHPQTRDMELLVTDGSSFVHEEKRDLVTSFEYIHPEALGVRYTNADKDGRYQLVKEIICDPHHSVVLMHVRLQAGPNGTEDFLDSLKIYALIAPHMDGGGAGNSARAVDVAGQKVLVAWKNRWTLAMGADCGLSHVSCGFVGASDGWRDLTDNFKMDWEFGSATNGNLALMGQINLQGSREFTLGIGIGDSHHSALSKTMGALSLPFPQNATRFLEQWQRAASPYRLATKAGDQGLLMQTSHNILLAHEDKTYSGAFVASASIPWGQAKGDDDLGGYHLVWTRDMVQTATALLACGRVDTARRALVYLACTQRPDGSFAQNFWIDGRPYWTGVQLDEVAFPLILTWRIWKAGGLGNWDVFPFIERAAGFLVKNSPVTHQERWEENSGYSPSTLAAVIGGLICAAEIARDHQSLEFAAFLEEYADWIEMHLEDWTVTNDGVLLPEVKRHYMRIRPPESGDAVCQEGPGTEKIHINNRPPGTRYDFEAREIIDAGFLELVRYGIRRADDPLMVDSLKVVDAVLKRDLPQGPGWLRYNWDGYGQGAHGEPFQSYGQGRVWPLLTGERAHYELAAGKDVSDLIKTYEGFATAGNMLPEQVWDTDDRPEDHLTIGGPAGSACPLVWAHAEYLKLLRSALDNKVFDRIEPVYRRYGRFRSEHNHARSAHHGRAHEPVIEMFSLRRPIQAVTPHATVRVLADKRFVLVWTDDAWQTTNSTQSRSLGSAGFSADILPGQRVNSTVLSLTFFWPEENRWLGHNYDIRIEEPNPAEPAATEPN
jgi:glucoamylase